MSATPDPQLPETLVSPSDSPPNQPLPALTPTAPHSHASPADFEEANRALLHRRLLICEWVCLVGTSVLLVVTLAHGQHEPGETLGLVTNVLFVAGGLAGLVALRGRPSMRRLRATEVLLFGSFALLCGVLRYIGNLSLPPDSPDPQHAKVAVEYATALANMPVYFTIFLYGLLIPTTRRHGAAMIIWMAAVPPVAIAASGIANPALRPYVPFTLAVTVIGVGMSGAAALFGASRLYTLQREVYDARREAEQVGPYTLKRKLGAGGMGEVWLAEHRLLKRPCAVKFIRAELAANPTNAARFAREVRAVTAMTHFNTIRIYDYGQSEEGSFYYVMEYLDGPTLESLVHRNGPLEPARAVYLLRQLCGALSEAHGAGLVHRDLKPNNVIVAALGGQRDVAKLLDFGLVQDLSTTDPAGRLTQAGVVVGTPAYMCPEQAGGSTAIDARGDVYSLGAVAFFMLTGRPPFEGNSVGRLMNAHLTQPAPDVRSLRADVPADVAGAVAKCLAKGPGERFQSANELEAALSACGCSNEWNSVRAAAWWREAHNSERKPT